MAGSRTPQRDATKLQMLPAISAHLRLADEPGQHDTPAMAMPPPTAARDAPRHVLEDTRGYAPTMHRRRGQAP